MNKSPKVYLIPNTLGTEASTDYSFPPENRTIIESIGHFAVENLKDSRRFLVKLNLKHKIDSSTFYILDKRSDSTDIDPILQELKKGNSVGIISDAGCPGIADPGSLLVKLAHKSKIQVVPLIGPSSILLALIASGFNGQSFRFSGYLNREKNIRSKEIKDMEQQALKKGETQIFMETPYRNEALWQDLLAQLNNTTLLCVAANISTESEYIRTYSVGEWKKVKKINLHKIPTIFLISA